MRLALAAQWLGLALLLVHLLGWFGHGDRWQIIHRLDDGEIMSLDEPVVRELLVELEVDLTAIAGEEDLRLVKSFGARGPVLALREEEGQERAVATWDEVSWWALEPSDAWAWLGWLLVLGGAVIRTQDAFSAGSADRGASAAPAAPPSRTPART